MSEGVVILKCLGECGATSPETKPNFPYICLDCWRAGVRWKLGVKAGDFITYRINTSNNIDPRSVK